VKENSLAEGFGAFLIIPTHNSIELLTISIGKKNIIEKHR